MNLNINMIVRIFAKSPISILLVFASLFNLVGAVLNNQVMMDQASEFLYWGILLFLLDLLRKTRK